MPGRAFVLTDEIQESLDRVELTQLTRLYNAAFARGAEELSEVMGEAVEAGSITAISGAADSLAAALPPELLTVEIAFGAPVSSAGTIVISADDAAALADRLSGNATGDDQAWVASMTRALERFIAARSDGLSTHIAAPVRITASVPAVRDLRIDDLSPSGDMMVRLSMELRVGQLLTIQVHELLSIRTARSILSLIPGAVPPPPGPRAMPAAPPRDTVRAEEASVPEPAVELLVRPVEEITDHSTIAPPPPQGDVAPPAPEPAPAPIEPSSVWMETSPAPASMEPSPALSGAADALRAPVPVDVAQMAQAHAVAAPPVTATVQPALFGALDAVAVPPVPRKIDVLMNVPVQMAVELGRVEVSVRDVLELAPGRVMSIKRTAGEPVTLMLNGRPIGRAEVVEIDGEYGIRVTEIANIARVATPAPAPSGDVNA